MIKRLHSNFYTDYVNQKIQFQSLWIQKKNSISELHFRVTFHAKTGIRGQISDIFEMTQKS